MNDPYEAARRAGIRVPLATSSPRVVIATAHTSDYQELASITVPTMIRYAQKQGYGFYYHNAWEKRIENDGDRCKIRIYEELYALGQYDVFVWIDADAMITNPEVTVEGLLARLGVDDSAHFVWGHDIAGPNTGVYLARFTPQAAMFLHASFSRGVEMGWGDNTAMIQLSLVPPHSEIIRCVPGRYLNAYLYGEYGWERYNEVGDWRTARAIGDDFILHFPGLPQEKRIVLARQIVQEIYG